MSSNKFQFYYTKSFSPAAEIDARLSRQERTEIIVLPCYNQNYNNNDDYDYDDDWCRLREGCSTVHYIINFMKMFQQHDPTISLKRYYCFCCCYCCTKCWLSGNCFWRCAYKHIQPIHLSLHFTSGVVAVTAAVMVVVVAAQAENYTHHSRSCLIWMPTKQPDKWNHLFSKQQQQQQLKPKGAEAD